MAITRLNNNSASSITTLSGVTSIPNLASLPSGLGGKVLQVVQGNTSTQVNNTSASYAGIGLSASITPSSTSSKILVNASVSHVGLTGGDIYVVCFLGIFRDSTNIQEWNANRVRSGAGGSNHESGASCSLSYLDSPSSTSSITYSIQQRLEISGSSRTSASQYNNRWSTIQLLEIGA